MEEAKAVPDGFWEEVQALFSEDVDNVLQLLETNQVVFVLAPHRIGKSEMFIPQLAAGARQVGYRVGVMARPYQLMFGEVRQTIAATISMGVAGDESTKNLFVLDEAVSIVESFRTETLNARELKTKEILTKIFRVLAGGNIRGVFILATSSVDGREYVASKWSVYAREAGISVGGYTLNTTHLPNDLVGRLLRYWNADQELTAFFLANENKAIRTYWVLRMLMDPFPPHENAVVPPFRTLDGLRAYLCKEYGGHGRYEAWLTNRVGGSSTDWVQLVKNLGIIRNEEEMTHSGMYLEYD